MESRTGWASGGPADSADELRLRWLDVHDDADDVAVLRRALHHAVAALNGFGGLAHLVGEADRLDLAAVSGVPTAIARRWEHLAQTEASLAPVRALELLDAVWSSTHTAAADGGPEEAGHPGRLPKGMLSVPLIVDGTPVGTLSVLADEPPQPDRARFFVRLATVASAKLPARRRRQSGATPWWQDQQSPQMMRQVRVGTWSWDLPSGLLDFDPVTEELVRLAGLDPDRWDRHIQTWMDRIHPDDRPAVQRAIEQSFIDGDPYAVEYRVIAEDGTVSLLELRAVFEFDPTGTPVRMTGTAWNMSARRSQEGWLVALLEMHPDPLYVMSVDGPVEWANVSGRALAGLKVVGATLPPDLYAAVEALLDRARSAPETPETAEVSLEHAPGEARLYHVRAVRTGGFITMSMVGVDSS